MGRVVSDSFQCQRKSTWSFRQETVTFLLDLPLFGGFRVDCSWRNFSVVETNRPSVSRIAKRRRLILGSSPNELSVKSYAAIRLDSRLFCGCWVCALALRVWWACLKARDQAASWWVEGHHQTSSRRSGGGEKEMGRGKGGGVREVRGARRRKANPDIFQTDLLKRLCVHYKL